MSIFSNVAGRNVKRSKFNRSHEKKMSCNMGELVPIYLDEVVPGDKFRVSSEILMRMAPMVAPIMHRVNVYTHYFFVPNRLVWDSWESFITGGEQGTDSPITPKIKCDNTNAAFFLKGRIPDYYGLPVTDGVTVTQAYEVSAMPFRAYQTIYNEYYRDQNLTSEVLVNKTDGLEDADNTNRLTTMRKRCWEKDYFTSALPWAQRGGEVLMPLSIDESDINYKATAEVPAAGGVVGNLQSIAGNDLTIAGSNPAAIHNIDSIDNGTITINDLRKSARLQEWLERSARYGSRYIEQILAHFGVRSSDKRLQRPEYLGGGKQNVVISEVLNTAGDTGASSPLPQGNMSGHGISVGNTNSFKKYFEEHGYVIGIMSILPRTAYQQGIHKMWNRTDKFDYYWPEFARLGEQAVTNAEIYHDFTGGSAPENTFGYQSRYAEYKYGCSHVSGDFRDELNFYHMGRVFANPPALNTAFVESNPTDRIYAVNDPTEDKLYCHIYNKVDAIRPMPYFNNPTL